jgi:hypothetical protein
MATGDSTSEECQADTKPADDNGGDKPGQQDLWASLSSQERAQRPVISARH